MSAWDLARLRAVSSVAVSPGSERIAYVLSAPRRPFENEDGPAWQELHVVNRQGASLPFVTGEVNVSRVRWTPDGRGIAFLAKRGSDEHEALYRIAADGGEARKLIEHDTEIRTYSFSPDGSRVAYLATEKKKDEEKERFEKGFNQEIPDEDWRPVRVWVAALGDEKAEPRLFDLEGSAADLHWSPTGDRLVLSLAPTPLVDDRYMRRRLRVVEIKSGKITAKISNTGKLGRLRWSPDGQHVAFVSGVDAHDPREGRLMVAPVEGGEPRDLTPNYHGHVRSFAWLDGRTILFVGDEGVWTTLVRVGIDGTGRDVLVSSGGPILSGIHLSRDASVATFLGETPAHPPEVYRMEVGKGAPERLTSSNPWLTEIRLASQEIVSFTTRDGLELEGLYVRPLGGRSGKRTPLVVIVHGGPEAHYRNGWLTTYSRPAQVLAARGFAVFYPNYRGSTGRGLIFSKLSQGDLAGKEFDDLVDGVDHLVASGLVNKERVGITGGSYGGYATAWGSTYYSKRFAAGVMFVGISDLISKAATSDIPNELYLVHARRNPWEDWQFFLERSPIYHAEKSRTPLLILHGKEDPRVNPAQSLELYRVMQRRSQAPVRLVLYPGEKHGNRRAASRLDYTMRLVRWMEHYLKADGGAPPAYQLDYGEESRAEENDRD